VDTELLLSYSGTTPDTFDGKEAVMRRLLAGWTVGLALMLPGSSAAQMLMRPAPYPLVTAAGAAWQVGGDPIAYGGALYYPVGPAVFFDGNLMSRSGTFEGVPLYQDATLAPFTIVYVPIGSGLMRPYERPRVGELAGTVGTRTPSFPIQRDGEATSPFAPVYLVADTFQTVAASEPVATPIASAEPPGEARHVTIGSVPAPGTPNGVWLEYDGSRWYSAGAAVPFVSERFVQIGVYREFPVYRDKSGDVDTIFVVSGRGGLVAAYRRR
jgi:hypothetical protein